MKRAIFFILILLLTQSEASDFYVANAPIFYGTVGVQTNVKSRLGNQILSYIKAQWVAEKFNLPYLHVHFDDDYLLKAGNAHLALEDFINKNSKTKIIGISNFSEISDFRSKSYYHHTVFEINFHSRADNTPESYLHEWNEMRKNHEFINKMRSLFTPKSSLNILEIPSNMKTIAIHIRKGGGYDLPLWSLQYFDEETLFQESRKIYDFSKVNNYYLDMLRPLKAPPEQYYIDQLNTILQKYPKDNFYIHIFTDDPYPGELTKRLNEKLCTQNGQVIFNTRQKGNRHDANIIEDLLSMLNFDILIRSLSTYSEFSHILGNHQLVIYPQDYMWIGRCLVYTDVLYEKIDVESGNIYVQSKEDFLH